MTTTQTRISYSKVFEDLGYRPHRHQKLVHSSHSRNKVVSAGRRLGKSELGAGELDVEAVRARYMLADLIESGQRREFWIIGPEYTDAEKEFRKHWNALKSVDAPFDKPGSYYDAHASDMQISMFKGKYLVLGKSAKHPERLVGEGLNGAIMAEAAKQKERTWTKFVRPMLSDYNGWSIHSSTPEGKNWFYDLYMRGQDPLESSWASWRFPAWLNPHVYPDGATQAGIAAFRDHLKKRKPYTAAMLEKMGIDPEVAELVKDLSEETFKQEIAGDFTEFAGRVFKDFDDEYHVRDLQYSPLRQTFAAVDYGFTNPFVWLLLQVDDLGTVYILDELYEPGLAIDDAAREIDERGLCPAGLTGFYPDPASPGDTLALERHLRVRSFGGTGGELNTRLRYIRNALKDRNAHLDDTDPLRHPKLLIDRRCTNTIREMNDYRYPETSKEQKRDPADKPMKKDDHTPEALGRFYVGHYGPVPEASVGGGSRVAGSSISGR